MRRDDIANARRLNREVRCYNCQKPAEREVIKHYGEKPNEKYMGNLEIRKEIPVKDSDGKIRYNYELFTGWLFLFSKMWFDLGVSYYSKKIRKEKRDGKSSSS